MHIKILTLLCYYMLYLRLQYLLSSLPSALLPLPLVLPSLLPLPSVTISTFMCFPNNLIRAGTVISMSAFCCNCLYLSLHALLASAMVSIFTVITFMLYYNSFTYHLYCNIFTVIISNLCLRPLHCLRLVTIFTNYYYL